MRILAVSVVLLLGCSASAPPPAPSPKPCAEPTAAPSASTPKPAGTFKDIF